MRKILYLILFIIFINYYTNPIKLIYKYDPNIFLILITNVEFKHYLNGNFLGQSKTQEVTSIDTKSVNNDIAEINATTYIMEKRKLMNEDILRVNEKLKYKFRKDLKGTTYGLNFKKGFHDFPRFIDKDLKIGDTWELPSYYVISLLETSASIKLDINVQYRFLGMIEEDNRKLALISANAIMVQDNSLRLFSDYRLLKITGFNNFLIKFDVQNGRIFSIDETFDYLYIMDDLSIIETIGKSYSFCQKSKVFSKDDKEEIETKIQQDKDLKDVKVDLKGDKTLSITLEKILFYPDKVVLLEGEYKRLDKIAEIIAEKYRSNRIIIVGHTADIGKKESQKLLSEERARVILDYLVEKHNFNRELLSYEGKGAEEPIGDNLTEEGRAKNRRVEIIIITN